jgi:hypothetical protein
MGPSWWANVAGCGGWVVAILMLHAPIRALAQEGAPVPTPPGTVTLEFRAPVADLDLYVLRPSGQLELLCNGHCQVGLAPGAYQFALSRYGRTPILVPGQTLLRTDVAATGRYRSRKGARVAGWIIAVVGIAHVVWGILNAASFAIDEGKTGIWVGPVLGGAAFMATGFGLAFGARDRASLGVQTPGSPVLR